MDSFLNPEKVLKELKLKENMIAVDFGSGSGGWTIPLAKKLEDGIVYAIDILEEPISALLAKAKLEKVSNIKTIVADVEKNLDIPEESIDLVLITNLLFQVDDKKSVIAQAKIILRPGGKILVIDWKKEAPFGLKESRVSAEEVIELAKELKLKLEKEFSAGDYHYGLIFEK